MKNLLYILCSLLVITIISCSKDDDAGTSKSDAKLITEFSFLAEDNESLDQDISFSFDGVSNVITIEVPYGTDITNLMPDIEISEDASVSPQNAQDFSSDVIYTVTAEDGTKTQYTVTVNVASNTDAKIISFAFIAENNTALEEDITAVIDEDAKTVTAYVTYGTDITELTPTLEVSPQATYSPEDAQDFSSEVTYTVTAGDESTQVDYTLNVIESSNSDAKILSFAFLAENNTALEEDVTAVIDEEAKIVTAEVPYGTDITALIPTVNVSPDATFTPEGAQDFSSEVVYAITAGDESTQVDYTINVSFTANTEAKIVSFVFLAENNAALDEDVTAVIDEETKTITTLMPYGTNMTSLLPDIEISEDASINPEGSGDFSNEVIYSVTAQDGSVVTYNVIVNIDKNPQLKALIAIYEANPGNTLGWDLENPDIGSWAGVTTDADGNVIRLYFWNKNLTKLPAEIGQFVHLKNLDLSSNKLEELPAEIGQLVNLTWLSFYVNNLTSIPAEIGLLANLTMLDLGYNQLTTLPAEIGELNKLTYLRLIYNKFTIFPAVIGQLNNLTELRLSHNRLTTVPDEIGQLTNLKKLFIEFCDLTTVSPEIGKLVNLTSLSLLSNDLVTIPADIGQLVNLTYLNISKNDLTSIPQEVCNLETNYGTGIELDEGVTCE